MNVMVKVKVMAIANMTPLFGFTLLLAGCASTFTEAGKLPVEMRHKLDGDTLVIEAVVTNLSDRSVTFIDHPDHLRMSVAAGDRSKDEAHDLMTISFVRATREHLETVRPSESVKFVRRFIMREGPSGSVEVGELPRMRIRDDTWVATFSYRPSREFLPKSAWRMRKSFVMTRLHARHEFPRPR